MSAVIDWLNANAGAVQALTAIAIVALTGALVWATWDYARTTREFIQQGILPYLVVRGDTLMPPHLAPTKNVPLGQPFAIELENVGKGPALWVQWEAVFPQLDDGLVVPRSHTYLDRIGAMESRCPFHTRGGDQGIVADEGLQITLWYDDSYGSHYRTVYQRRGDRWSLDESKRERTRPPLRDQTTLSL